MKKIDSSTTAHSPVTAKTLRIFFGLALLCVVAFIAISKHAEKTAHETFQAIVNQSK